MFLFAHVGHENIIASLLDFHSNFINWLLLVAIVYWLVRNFIPPVISKRQQSINNELAMAAKTRQDAELALAEQKRQIEQASKAAEQIVVEAKETAKQMSNDIKQQTEKDMSEMLTKFEMAAHNERQAAILEMRAVVSKAAVKLAEQNLNAILSPGNKAKIANEFMAELSKLNQSNLGTDSQTDGPETYQSAPIEAKVNHQRADLERSNKMSSTINEQN